MGDLTTYSLDDFFPIGRDVYFRLIVRHNDGVWPAHIAALLAGIVAVWLAIRGRGRFLGLLLAICWVFVGWTFHLDLYANLNWGATYTGWGFIAQGILLAGYGLAGWLDRADEVPLAGAGWSGVGLAVFALALYPLVGPLAGRSWAGLQVFGIAPNPTAIATLGLVLTADRTPKLLLVGPLLWCLVAAATGIVMDAPSDLVTAGAGGLGLGVAIWKGVARVGES